MRRVERALLTFAAWIRPANGGWPPHELGNCRLQRSRRGVAANRGVTVVLLRWRSPTCALVRPGTRRRTACSGRRRPKVSSRVRVAPGGAGVRAGIVAGDLLVAVGNGRSSRRPMCSTCCIASRRGEELTYTSSGRGSAGLIRLQLRGVPTGHRALHFVQAAVAIFTLIVGCLVRLRRPERSGVAALLLAVGRVLRRLRLLVQRPARPPRLGRSTGPTSSRCCCCRRSSSTSRWSSPIDRTRGSGRRWAARCCR